MPKYTSPQYKQKSYLDYQYANQPVIENYTVNNKNITGNNEYIRDYESMKDNLHKNSLKPNEYINDAKTNKYNNVEANYKAQRDFYKNNVQANKYSNDNEQQKVINSNKEYRKNNEIPSDEYKDFNREFQYHKGTQDNVMKKEEQMKYDDEIPPKLDDVDKVELLDLSKEDNSYSSIKKKENLEKKNRAMKYRKYLDLQIQLNNTKMREESESKKKSMEMMRRRNDELKKLENEVSMRDKALKIKLAGIYEDQIAEKRNTKSRAVSCEGENNFSDILEVNRRRYFKV